MSDFKPAGLSQRQRRRWFFSDCVFDEASWSLTVNGKRVAVEAKPLELLTALLEEAGNLVSKDALLDRIWPDVTVVEASLPTAVHKLRLVFNDDARASQIIETVPRAGYRLGVPVRLEFPQNHSTIHTPSFTLAPERSAGLIAPRQGWTLSMRLLSISAALFLVASLGLFALGPWYRVHAAMTGRTFTVQEVRNPLRRLDVRAVEDMIAAGWNPNSPLDSQGNAAINYVLGRCEWDHGHNQEQILLMVRTLTEAGAIIDRRNVWGDTPYSIAKADRYCGPDHPVTRYLRMLCTEGSKPLGDRCLATYELARRDRRS